MHPAIALGFVGGHCPSTEVVWVRTRMDPETMRMTCNLEPFAVEGPFGSGSWDADHQQYCIRVECKVSLNTCTCPGLGGFHTLPTRETRAMHIPGRHQATSNTQGVVVFADLPGGRQR